VLNIASARQQITIRHARPPAIEEQTSWTTGRRRLPSCDVVRSLTP
jgi:hypothetical protein